MRAQWVSRWVVGPVFAAVVLGGAEWSPASTRDLTVMPKVAPGSVPITGNYWALVIGIDKYKEAPPLDSAVKDATGVRDVLVERYGFKRERVIELLNEQATRTRIEDALYRLGQEAGPEDSILIYYAGHGQYDKEGRLGWWVPVEGQPQSPGTFINNAAIRDYIDGMKAKHVYLVADSCFSGTLFGKSRAMPPLNDKFFQRLYANKSRWGLTSGGTEPVADAGKGGHSIFAYHFIKLLKDNAEPYLVPSHIFDQIAPIIANNADQTPRSEPLKNTGDEGGQFVFRLVVRPSTGSGGSPKAGGLAPASAGGDGRVPVPGLPSAALSQAEQELKALEELERQTEEKKKKIELAKAYPLPQQAGKEITGKDGVAMVLVPGGQFWMGSSANDVDRAIEDCKTQLKKDEPTCRGWFAPEQPRHQVTLDAFYLDQYEVTNRLFDKFVKTTGYQTTAEKEGTAFAWIDGKGWQDTSGATWRQPEAGAVVFASDRAHHPVVSVSWHDAEAYCFWAGKRLPTEAEFEYATRAGTQTRYWWGNGTPGTRKVANVADESARNVFSVIMTGYDDGYVKTAPVGSFEANPFGLFDMTGNVSEWTADWFGGNYYATSPERNPTGPSSGQYRVFRGGSWVYDPIRVRSAVRARDTPTYRSALIGFRCAQDAQ